MKAKRNNNSNQGVHANDRVTLLYSKQLSALKLVCKQFCKTILDLHCVLCCHIVGVFHARLRPLESSTICKMDRSQVRYLVFATNPNPNPFCVLGFGVIFCHSAVPVFRVALWFPGRIQVFIYLIFNMWFLHSKYRSILRIGFRVRVIVYMG